MTMSRWLPLHGLAAFLVVVCMALPVALNEYAEALKQSAPERRVAAMDGIGAGWIDTLRRVAGSAEIDTLTRPILDYYAPFNLIGLSEAWYDRVRVGTDLGAYMRFSKSVSAHTGHAYYHPTWLAYPAAVIAHEFGHQYQRRNSAWRNWHPEVFADYFAQAALQLRGWLPAEDSDNPSLARLRHELRYRLIASYWP